MSIHFLYTSGVHLRTSVSAFHSACCNRPGSRANGDSNSNTQGR